MFGVKPLGVGPPVGNDGFCLCDSWDTYDDGMLALTEALAHWNLSKQSERTSSTDRFHSTTPVSRIS